MMGYGNSQYKDKTMANVIQFMNNVSGEIFGGASSGVIAVGHAYASDKIFFALPISMVQKPSGITVSGTFAMRDKTFTEISTNIPSTDIVIDSNSNKVCGVRVINNTSLTIGDVYYLYNSDSSSQIVVNP